MPTSPGPATQAPLRVALVGLGVIGRVHLEVLTALDRVQLAFTVDPRVGRSTTHQRTPHFSSLAEAVRAGLDPDLVVLATPTSTHVELVDLVLERTTAVALSEKPLSDDPRPIEDLRGRHGSQLERVRVVNHFAFSPEVEWAVAAVARDGWGTPASVVSTFNDPYVLKSEEERRSYVSSWVDSGANQLPLLARFTPDFVVSTHHEEAGGLRAATSVVYEGGAALLVSNWRTGDSSKQTRLRWSDDRELVLDHTAMTGHLLEAGRLVEHFGHDGRVSRKIAHYRAMYQMLFDQPHHPLLSVELAEAVAHALRTASTAAAGRSTRWVAAQPHEIR
jgi:predicted dehydrogenase